MHYGVKGMKWGVRKDRVRDPLGEDKIAYKYNKSGESGWIGAGRALRAKTKNKTANRDPLGEDRIAYKYNKPGESGWIGAGRALKSRYSKALKDRGYKRYSKNNTLKMALGREITNKKNYMKATPSRIRNATDIRGKGREIVRTYLDMPVTVIGFTGTQDTTVRKRLKKGDLVF